MNKNKEYFEKKLWSIANIFRSKTGGSLSDIKDYLIGLLFYKHLSVRCNDDFVEVLGKDYTDEKITDEIFEDVVENIGYCIKYNNLWDTIIKKITTDRFSISDIDVAFSNITENSEEGKLDNIFEGINFHAKLLGSTEVKRKKVIEMLIMEINNLNIDLAEQTNDLLGHLFEYLLKKFAQNGGKAGGEFYTPPSVSSLLAEITTYDKQPKITIYDPTCGSGAMLIQAVKSFGKDRVSRITGQELNPLTYNLARMNMFIQNIEYDKFTIKNTDTLFDSQIDEEKTRFTSIIANPPYGVTWEPADLELTNSNVFTNLPGKPGKKNGEILFLHHMLHHLDESYGTLAVVLPTGVTFRTGGEEAIREYYVEKDYIEAVIALPKNMFYGTSIDPNIIVMKKCKEIESKGKIKFIDARNLGDEEDGNIVFSEEDKLKIMNAYKSNDEIDKTSYIVSNEAILENKADLDINTYVKRERIDVLPFDKQLKIKEEVFQEILNLNNKINAIKIGK